MKVYHCKRLSLKTSNPNLCKINKGANFPNPICVGCTDGLVRKKDAHIIPSEPPQLPSKALCTKCGVNLQSTRDDTTLCSLCLSIEQKRFAAEYKKRGRATEEVYQPPATPKHIAKKSQDLIQKVGQKIIETVSKEKSETDIDTAKLLEALVESTPKNGQGSGQGSGQENSQKAVEVMLMPGCRNCGNIEISLNKKGWCASCWGTRIKEAKKRKKAARKAALEPEDKCIECGKPNKLLNDEGLCSRCHASHHAFTKAARCSCVDCGGMFIDLNDDGLCKICSASKKITCAKCGKIGASLNDDGWCSDCVNIPFHDKPTMEPSTRKPKKHVYEVPKIGMEDKAGPGHLDVTFRFTGKDARLLMSLLDEQRDHRTNAKSCALIAGNILIRSTWQEEEK